MIDGIYSICVDQSQEKPQFFVVADKLKKLEKAYCLESSLNQSTLYIAGASADSKPVIMATSFDSELKVKRVFDASKHQLGLISCMKRVAKTDFLVLGGVRSLIILDFNGAVFSIMGKVVGAQTGVISDFDFYQNCIYTVCERDRFICKVELSLGNVGGLDQLDFSFSK